MIESDTDRETMLLGLGGAPVTAPRGTLTGLLDLEYTGVGDIPVDSFSPRLTVRTSEAKRCGIDGGVTVYVAGTPYFVRSIQPDGTGMTVLELEGP